MNKFNEIVRLSKLIENTKEAYTTSKERSLKYQEDTRTINQKEQLLKRLFPDVCDLEQLEQLYITAKEKYESTEERFKRDSGLANLLAQAKNHFENVKKTYDMVVNKLKLAGISNRHDFDSQMSELIQKKSKIPLYNTGIRNELENQKLLSSKLHAMAMDLYKLELTNTEKYLTDSQFDKTYRFKNFLEQFLTEDEKKLLYKNYDPKLYEEKNSHGTVHGKVHSKQEHTVETISNYNQEPHASEKTESIESTESNEKNTEEKSPQGNVPTKLKEETKLKIQMLQAKNKMLVEKISNIKNDTESSLKTMISELDKEQNSIVENLSNTRNQIENLRALKVQAKELIVMLNKEIDGTELAAQNGINELVAEIDKLQLELNIFRQKISDQNQDLNNEIKFQTEFIDKGKLLYEKLKKTVEGFGKEIARLGTEVSDLKNNFILEVDKGKDFATEWCSDSVNTYLRNLQNLKEKVDVRTSQLNKLSNDKKVAEQRILEIDKNIPSAQNAINELRNRIKFLNNDFAVKEKQKEAILAQKQDVFKGLSEKMVLGANEKANNLFNQIEEQKTIVAENESKITELKKRRNTAIENDNNTLNKMKERILKTKEENQEILLELKKELDNVNSLILYLDKENVHPECLVFESVDIDVNLSVLNFGDILADDDDDDVEQAEVEIEEPAEDKQIQEEVGKESELQKLIMEENLEEASSTEEKNKSAGSLKFLQSYPEEVRPRLMQLTWDQLSVLEQLNKSYNKTLYLEDIISYQAECENETSKLEEQYAEALKDSERLEMVKEHVNLYKKNMSSLGKNSSFDDGKKGNNPYKLALKSINVMKQNGVESITDYHMQIMKNKDLVGSLQQQIESQKNRHARLETVKKAFEPISEGDE